jgi:ketosteroid isomerase-like protein
VGADENIKTIQTLYDAFGRGDVQTILDALSDDVEWASDTSSTVAPWYGVHRGKNAVAAFFQEFGSTMEVEEFTPHTFGSNDTDVFALVKCMATSLATGKKMDMTLHHYFRFKDGKIVYYRGTEDSAQTEAALRP